MDNADQRIGQVVGNYRLTRLLGSGGFAAVYLGENIHLNTNTHVAAIKVFNPIEEVNEVETEYLKALFRDEAQKLSQLRHPNIVPILDFGFLENENETPYLVMKYAPGGSIRSRHPRGSILPLETILNYVKQAASGLQYIHDNKLIHRDIKPDNILLGDDDIVWISDFGSAVVAHRESSLITQDGLGAPHYKAPEHWNGKSREASDQYSLGITVYEWLCGHRPFSSSGFMGSIEKKHKKSPPPSLCRKIDYITPELEKVVFTALAKNHKKRYSSILLFAEEFEFACERIIYSSDPEIRIPTVPLSEQIVRKYINKPENHLHNNNDSNNLLDNESKVEQPTNNIPNQLLNNQLETDKLIIIRQSTGVDLLGQNDPRSESIGIIYVEAECSRQDVLLAILAQNELNRKRIVIVLHEQNKAFQRPVDFDGLKDMRRTLKADMVIVARAGSSSAEFARQRRFPVYSSLESFGSSMQDEEPVQDNRKGWFGRRQKAGAPAGAVEQMQPLPVILPDPEPGNIAPPGVPAPAQAGAQFRDDEEEMPTLTFPTAGAAAAGAADGTTYLDHDDDELAPPPSAHSRDFGIIKFGKNTKELPSLAPTAAAADGATGVAAASTAAPASKPVKRGNGQKRRVAPLGAVAAAAGGLGGAAFAANVTQTGGTPPGSGGRPRRRSQRILAITFVILTLLLLASIAFASPPGQQVLKNILPGTTTTATVTITPVSQDVSNTYVITAITGTPDTAKRQVQARIWFVTPPSYSTSANATGSISGQVVITQKDITSASNNLISAVILRAQSQLAGLVKSTEDVVPNSLSCKTNVSADHKAGDVAPMVTVTGTATCSEEMYDKAGALKLAATLLTAQAAQNPGTGYAPAQNKIVTGVTGATVIDTNQTISLLVSADGIWVYQFTTQIKQQLANAIANKSKVDALTYLKAQPGVKDVSLTISNGGGTLPGASDITFNILGVNGPASTPTLSVGSPTPQNGQGGS